ncbi:hypothetical protein MBLNU457_6055t1 [Dothideomycetes sp. NU457]
MEEPTTHVSPASLMTDGNHSRGTPSMSPDPYVKMEDFTMPPPHTSLSVTKPVKKRKSWGQELPEPKTALPPRKRAKTDDEKEQRRIERIKRNRAAAHNSRERKRVEAEHLAKENEQLRAVLDRLQQSLAHKDAQLAKCKELLPNGLPEVTVDDSSSYESQSPSSSYTIDPRASLVSDSTPATSPADSAYIKMEEPTTLTMPPPAHPEAHAPAPHQLDSTQHSAAMLCDLQCQSSQWGLSQPLLPSTFPAWCLATITYSIMTTILHQTIMTTYKSLLVAYSTLSPTTMARYLTRLSTTSSTLTRRHHRRSAMSISQTPWPTQQISSLLALSPLSVMAMLMTLQPTSMSTATLAQQFLLATGLSMRGSSARALTQSLDEQSSNAEVSRNSGWGSHVVDAGSGTLTGNSLVLYAWLRRWMTEQQANDISGGDDRDSAVDVLKDFGHYRLGLKGEEAIHVTLPPHSG